MKRFNLVVIAACGLLFTACVDDDLRVVLDSAEDDAIAQNEFKAMFDHLDDTGNRNITGKTYDGDSLIPSCVSSVQIFRGPNAAEGLNDDQAKIIVDFGQNGCTCRDGVTRKGRLTGLFTGTYRTAGSTLVISTDDYYFQPQFQTGYNQVIGTKVITNLGSTDGVFKYRGEVNDGKIIYSDGTETTWSTEAISERIQGEGTVTPFDDVYSIQGTSNGINRQGKTYTGEVSTPLVKDMGCLLQLVPSKYFRTGVVTFQSDGNTLSLDYAPDGVDACDRKVRVTFNDFNPVDLTL